MQVISSINCTRADMADGSKITGDIVDEPKQPIQPADRPPSYSAATSCAHCTKYHHGNPYHKPNPPKRSEERRHFTGKLGDEGPGPLTAEKLKLDRRCTLGFAFISMAALISVAVVVGVKKKHDDDRDSFVGLIIVLAAFFSLSALNYVMKPKEKDRPRINHEREEIVEGLTCRCGKCCSTVAFWCVAAQRAEFPYLPKERKSRSSAPSSGGV